MTLRSREPPAILLLQQRLPAHYALIGNRQREISMYEDYDDEIAQIQREITEECMEYGENIQRSEDEDWF